MKTTTRHNDDEETTRYAQFGLAALIPGMQHAVDVLQRMLDAARTQLAAYQGLAGEPPSKPAKKAKKANRGWSADPEERRAEGARRQEVARLRKREQEKAVARKKGLTLAGKPLKLHPRDPNHPKHEAWVRNLQRAKKRAQRQRQTATKKLPKVVLAKEAAA